LILKGSGVVEVVVEVEAVEVVDCLLDIDADEVGV
jgi:hypothetical protein